MPGKYFYSLYFSASGNSISWMDFIFPYVKSIQVFICPSATRDRPAGRPNESYPSYGYNSAFYNANTSYTGSQPRLMPLQMAAAKRPAELIMNMDLNWTNNLLNPSAFNGRAVPSNNDYQSFAPHFEGTNIVFADGHVKWRSASSLRQQIPATCKGNTFYAASPGYCNNAKEWNPFID